MKRIFAMMLLFVLLASCARTGTTESTTEETTEAGAIALTTRTSATTEIRTYPTETTTTKRAIDPNKVIEDSVLGIRVGDTSPKELLKKLENLKIHLLKGEDGNEKIYFPDPNDSRMKFCYESDFVAFFFDKNDVLQRIAICNSAIATEREIRIGDSLEKLYEAYGSPDRVVGADDGLYYTNGECFLEFITDGERTGIYAWDLWGIEPTYWEDSY